MSKLPVISVLTPLYNTNVDHLKEMIESVLKQTYRDFEFIILNDSPDNKVLRDVVLSYDDKRIKFIENDRNFGISESRNRLIDLALGEYVAILDHDDICSPERFEKQLNYLQDHPEVGVCGSWCLVIPANKIRKEPVNNLDIKYSLMYGCCMIHTSVMIRKSILDNYTIRYEEHFSPAEDYMIFIKLMSYTMFYNIPEPLVKYREFNGNTTSKQIEKMSDRGALARSFAYSKYGVFFQPESIRTRKINLFGIVPLLKIKRKSRNCKWVYLFGFIPFLKIYERL